jgi:hypothetical protein
LGRAPGAFLVVSGASSCTRSKPRSTRAAIYRADSPLKKPVFLFFWFGCIAHAVQCSDS